MCLFVVYLQLLICSTSLKLGRCDADELNKCCNKFNVVWMSCSHLILAKSWFLLSAFPLR